MSYINGSSSIRLRDRFSQLISRPPEISMEMQAEPTAGKGTHRPHTLGLKHYELTNHLGNVLTTISDRKLTTAPGHFTTDITSAQDYYPFGSLMPGRKYSSNSYRFGMNGMEKDDEITGITGSHTTALFWEYDTRIARRWNLDPKPQIFISDYAAFGNNPIIYVDPNGDYFFGLFGSTAEQRSAAAKFKKENGGTIINKHKKSIMVTFARQESFGITPLIVQHNQSFNKDGSLIPENGEIKAQKTNRMEDIENYLNSPPVGIIDMNVPIRFVGKILYGTVDGLVTFSTNFALVQDVFNTQSIGLNGQPNEPSEQIDKGIDGALTVFLTIATLEKSLLKGTVSYSKYADKKNWIKSLSYKTKEFYRQQVNTSVDENLKALQWLKKGSSAMDVVKQINNPDNNKEK